MCGFFAVAIAASEGGFDEFAFHFCEGHANAFGTGFHGFVVEPWPEVFRGDAFSDIDCAAAFDGILEFANISGPGVRFEEFEGFGGDLSGWPTFFERDLADEVFNEEGDVIGANPQRRRLECDAAEVLEEVITEAAFDGEPVEVDMCGGDEADIGTITGVVQDAGGTLFQEHGQAFLEWECDGVDIIEEDGSSVAHFEVAGEAIGIWVTEELEFQGFDGVEAAVDAEERFLSASAAAVQTFGDKGCAAAGFAANEDGAVVISCDANGFAEGLHGRCAADEVHEISVEELSAKFFVFADEFASTECIDESGAEARG